MVRGRRSAVSAYERRQWLEELEKGTGITQIARAARRDIRVVKRHIDVAIEERQIAQARRDFLLSRLEQHQADLLAEVRRLRQLITQYPPPRLMPDDPVQQKVHDALKEHTKRLPLKGLLESYESTVAEYKQARDSVSSQLADREAELVSSLPQEVATYPWTSTLVDAVESGLPLEEPSGPTYARDKQGEGMCEISWGAFHLTRSPVPEAKVPVIIDAHKRLLSCAEGYWPLFQEHRQRLRELADLVAEELEVFIIKRLVPGRCRYCPF